MSKTSTTRIQYIDTIKGMTILWVVVGHLGEIVPAWLMIGYRMPLFFFLSGIFFRKRLFKIFLVRRINTLLIPLIFWLILSWLFVVVKYEFILKFFPMESLPPPATWGLIGDVLTIFNVSNKEVYGAFLNNGPLWFLLALFNVQMLYYLLCSFTSKWYWILLICLVFYIVGIKLEEHGINGIFLIQHAFHFVVYYAVGSLIGEKLMEIIEIQSNRIWIAIVSFILLLLFACIDFGGYSDISLNVCIFCFIALVFVVFRVVGEWKIFAPLRFFGKNSLVVLATHMLIFSIFASICVKFIGCFASSDELSASVGYHVFLFFVVCVVDYFVIKFCNKFMPQFVGKKDLIKIE